MSYCVHCGVELETTLTNCPLCHTPVLDPNQITQTVIIPPYPKEKGSVEVVKRKDLAILLSIVLLSAGGTCGLLNLLVFRESLWSLLIVGICCCIWIFMIPVIIYTRLSIYTSLLLDGIALGLYLYLITFITSSDLWFYQLAIPIIVLLTIQVEIFTILMKKIKISFITTSLYIFSNIAVFCVALEIFISLFLHDSIRIIWSAIVLAVCVTIIISLITILSKHRLRESVRKRLHF